MLRRRWILVAAVAAVGLGALLWLTEARPDGRFEVLGEALLLEPVIVGESGFPTGPGITPGATISNAFVAAGTVFENRAGAYDWTETAFDRSGELISRRAQFREGPWTEIDASLVQRTVRDALGSEVVSYRVGVRGAITPDGSQWLFSPQMSGSGHGLDSITVGELRFEALARRLVLDVVEEFGDAPARRYRMAFVVELDGTMRRGDQ